jgi:hypothetical protein
LPRLETAARKTRDTLDEKRFPPSVSQQLREFARSDFLDCAPRMLGFGLPGVGKRRHTALATAHASAASTRASS